MTKLSEARAYLGRAVGVVGTVQVRANIAVAYLGDRQAWSSCLLCGLRGGNSLCNGCLPQQYRLAIIRGGRLWFDAVVDELMRAADEADRQGHAGWSKP